jgi:hypothetical protein
VIKCGWLERQKFPDPHINKHVLDDVFDDVFYSDLWLTYVQNPVLVGKLTTANAEFADWFVNVKIFKPI